MPSRETTPPCRWRGHQRKGPCPGAWCAVPLGTSGCHPRAQARHPFINAAGAAPRLDLARPHRLMSLPRHAVCTQRTRGRARDARLQLRPGPGPARPSMDGTRAAHTCAKRVADDWTHTAFKVQQGCLCSDDRKPLGEVGTALLLRSRGWGWESPWRAEATAAVRRAWGPAGPGGLPCNTKRPVVRACGRDPPQWLQGASRPPTLSTGRAPSPGQRAQGLGVALGLGTACYRQLAGPPCESCQVGRGPRDRCSAIPCAPLCQPPVGSPGRVAADRGWGHRGAPASCPALGGSACTRGPLHMRLANQDVPPGCRSRPLLIATHRPRSRLNPDPSRDAPGSLSGPAWNSPPFSSWPLPTCRAAPRSADE